ncbi:uncharacterized protein LOC131943489 [Physella acuta]|uniref:uncharacterized protein LOC131943489 n=1 Tax=Physella acuta TaxID=109671 RepID=UPI0027DB91BC|nr:uncharacterized protein LOC131943489 [Physella acuta]
MYLIHLCLGLLLLGATDIYMQKSEYQPRDRLTRDVGQAAGNVTVAPPGDQVTQAAPKDELTDAESPPSNKVTYYLFWANADVTQPRFNAFSMLQTTIVLGVNTNSSQELTIEAMESKIFPDEGIMPNTNSTLTLVWVRCERHVHLVALMLKADDVVEVMPLIAAENWAKEMFVVAPNQELRYLLVLSLEQTELRVELLTDQASPQGQNTLTLSRLEPTLIKVESQFASTDVKGVLIKAGNPIGVITRVCEASSCYITDMALPTKYFGNGYHVINPIQSLRCIAATPGISVRFSVNGYLQTDGYVIDMPPTKGPYLASFSVSVGCLGKTQQGNFSVYTAAIARELYSDVVILAIATLAMDKFLHIIYQTSENDNILVNGQPLSQLAPQVEEIGGASDYSVAKVKLDSPKAYVTSSNRQSQLGVYGSGPAQLDDTQSVYIVPAKFQFIEVMSSLVTTQAPIKLAPTSQCSSQSIVCMPGMYGETCEQLCQCQQGMTCRHSSACYTHSCDLGYYGLSCEISDLALLLLGCEPAVFYDNNRETCAPMGEQPIKFLFRGTITLTAIRMTFNQEVHGDALSPMVNTGQEQQEGCTNLVVTMNKEEVDITCQSPLVTEGFELTLHLNPDLTICSININGGTAIKTARVVVGQDAASAQPSHLLQERVDPNNCVSVDTNVVFITVDYTSMERLVFYTKGSNKSSLAVKGVVKQTQQIFEEVLELGDQVTNLPFLAHVSDISVSKSVGRVEICNIKLYGAKVDEPTLSTAPTPGDVTTGGSASSTTQVNSYKDIYESAMEKLTPKIAAGVSVVFAIIMLVACCCVCKFCM